MEIPHNLIKFINAKSVEDDLLFAAEDLLKKRRGDYYCCIKSSTLPDTTRMFRDLETLKDISAISPKLKEYIEKTYPTTYFYAFDKAREVYKSATCFPLDISSLKTDDLFLMDESQNWHIVFKARDSVQKTMDFITNGPGCTGEIKDWDRVYVPLPYDVGVIANPTCILVNKEEITFYDKHLESYYISKIAEYLQNNPNILKGLE